MSICLAGHRRALELAHRRRGHGGLARRFGSPVGTALNLLPAAIEAGSGEFGGHGSLIAGEMGALPRLASLATDLPVAPDRMVDIGAEDFRTRCQRCSIECPPHAVDDDKHTVRGVERWCVDSGECVPHFDERHGRGICRAVRPWSQPGVAAPLTRKMLGWRTPGSVVTAGAERCARPLNGARW
jgi:hypothetical protein